MSYSEKKEQMMEHLEAPVCSFNERSTMQQDFTRETLNLEEIFEALGAGGDQTREVAIYMPSADKHSNPIPDHAKWVTEAVKILTTIGGGATELPKSRGSYVDPATGHMVSEQIVEVYSHIGPIPLRQHLPELREFIHRMGQETNQAEVGLKIDGKFRKVGSYDERPVAKPRDINLWKRRVLLMAMHK